MTDDPEIGKLTYIYEVGDKRTVVCIPKAEKPSIEISRADVDFTTRFLEPFHEIVVSTKVLPDENGHIYRQVVPVEGERQNLENLLHIAFASVTVDSLLTKRDKDRVVEELSMALIEMGIKLT